MKSKIKILLIFTGGTICSFSNERGERVSDVKRAQALIVENFINGKSFCRNSVSFTVKQPLNILSENMTPSSWNKLISSMKRYDYSKYDGAILLHGTDTLAYTASLMSLVMAGTEIPLFIVSSNMPVYMEEANGNDNFRTAVELIANGICPNVYVPYRNHENDGEKMYIHYASHLLQCANYSDNFYSKDMTPCEIFSGNKTQFHKMPLYTFPKLKSSVLCITPHISLDYSRISLRGVKAVLHGTYHSSTLPTDAFPARFSALAFKKRCDKREIPFFIYPCDKNSYSYETTGKLLRDGAYALNQMTAEMIYVKLLCGVALGYSGEELYSYMNTEQNGEFVL